jgi:uncharacterized protein with PIN domain
MGLGGMRPGEGPEWEAVLDAVKRGESPRCPECEGPLKIRTDEALKETKPIGYAASCQNCKKWIGA